MRTVSNTDPSLDHHRHKTASESENRRHSSPGHRRHSSSDHKSDHKHSSPDHHKHSPKRQHSPDQPKVSLKRSKKEEKNGRSNDSTPAPLTNPWDCRITLDDESSDDDAGLFFFDQIFLLNV